MVGKNKTWPPAGKHVIYGLPELKTLKERKNNLYFEYYAGLPRQKPGKFVQVINEERRELGLPLISTSSSEVE